MAPTPTHTAYAVPTGRDFIANPNNPRLKTIENTVKTVGQSRLKPTVYFKPTAQPISKIPATIRIIHAILF